MEIQNIDCHNHLAEVFKQDQRKAQVYIDLALKKNIVFFMQGGIGPLNWDHQLEFKKCYPSLVGLCFGLHPYWISENSEASSELALDKLSHYLERQSKQENNIIALGEIGLDFRPQIVKESKELQIRMLELQLEMLKWFNIPAVFHFVKAFNEAQTILNWWTDSHLKGMIHSFNGTSEQAQFWVDKGLLLSIGGPVCYPKNQRLHQALLHIPLDHLLLETDSPDQSPPSYPKGENQPTSLWDVAKKIGSIRKLDAEEILDISNQNFQRVFGEIPHGS